MFGRAGGVVLRHPVVWLAWLVLVTASVWLGAWAALAVFVTAAGTVLVWVGRFPESWQRRVSGPLWRRGKLAEVRAGWSEVLSGCGLAVRSTTGSPMVPVLVRSRWRRGTLVLVPQLLPGQTVDDFAAATVRLRTAWGASRLRVVPDQTGTGCDVLCRFDDVLAEIFETPIPDEPSPTHSSLGDGAPADGLVDLDGVVLGRCEDGSRWVAEVRVPTLCAGSAGAGKGSVLWSLIVGLAPAVRMGVVELHGIDLKGGAELGMGRELFTRYADDLAAAVVLLEDAVAACEVRARGMAGVCRLHQPSVAEPLVVVVIDELASLVGYVTDRELLRRAETALARLLSIGRAPGFVVWGFVQDPRKETVKARHLFTQSVGLRLRDREEVTMILGDGALRAGADCHKILRTLPGVGYWLDEAGIVTRVRAGYVSDDAIRLCAQRFPTRRQVPVVVPEPVQLVRRRRDAA